MTVPEPHIIDRPLEPARCPDEYALHLAAVEWSLAESIIIETEEDIKSRPKWRDRLQPFYHQYQNLVTYCRRLPVMLLADDVGLGKTISAGLILSELMVRRRVNRALIVCPKILGPQWQQELREKFGLESEVAFGSRLDQALQSHSAIVITTYDSVRERIREIKHGQFEMLILDEAHRLRNLYGTRKPPRTAQNIREALEARLFTYVLMLTATPLHNRPADIYSLLDCLTVAKGHRHPLGTYEEFRAGFIEPCTKERALRREAIPVLHDVLREYLVRTRRADANLPFPERLVRTYSATMTLAEQMLQYVIARSISGISKPQQISLLQAMMSSPAALWHQARNMIEKGSLPETVWDDIDRAVRHCQRPAKLTAMLRLLIELQEQRPDDWRAVIFTSRLATQREIGRALAKAGIPYGFVRGAATVENALALEAFCAEPPRIRVLVSTDAGAEGINLQAANVIVNYDLPWNPMVVEQRIGRCQRLGSNHKHVVVWNLVVKNSVEESVVACLMQKLQTVSNAIGDIESILEVLGMEGGGTRSKSFEEQIRELVVASLLGRNVEQHKDRIARNIEEAKRLIEENQAEIDQVLGSPEPLDQRTRRALRLKHPDPSLTVKQFVVRCLQQEGAVVTEEENERCWVRWRDGREEEIIIVNASRRERLPGDANDDPDIHEPEEDSPPVYAPGQPRFEQIVDRWSKRAEQLIVDTRVNDERLCSELAQRWCEKYGFRFLSCRYLASKGGMYGSVAIRVTASNGIDRYEKMIRARLGNAQKEQAARRAGGRLRSDKITTKDVMQGFESEARRIISEDPDIRTFCEHYQRREQEELAKARGNTRQERRIINDFRPAVAGECVGMNGCLYSRGQLQITFSIDNCVYEIGLQVEPATGQILEPVEEGLCERTGRTVPRAALGRCAVSGKTVLRHFLAKSAISDRKALPEHLGVCEITGKTVLTTELGRSSLSGKVVLLELLQRSPLSGRLGLPEDFAQCQITGDAVLKDELVRSDLSGRLFRMDQKCISAVSGKVGHRSEMVRCDVTGEWLAPSEAGRSDFSGKQVRANLLRTSEKSGRKGLADEVVRCAVTGRLLLWDEAGRSAVSRQWCDQDLLQCSARSGLLALPQELTRCEETGALLLASETGICQVTGKRVDNRLLAVSALSGRTFLKRSAVCSVLSRRIGLQDEVGYCHWLDGPVLKDELGVCRLTGLTISRPFLNSDDELRPLRELLNGWSTEALSLPKGLDWLRSQHADFGRVKRMTGVRSPSKTVVAACVERTGFLGLQRRHAGVVIRLGDTHVVLAKTAWGKRIRGLWTVVPEGGDLMAHMVSFIRRVFELLGLAATAAQSTARNETITPASSERSREPTAACTAKQELAPSTTANRGESIAPR